MKTSLHLFLCYNVKEPYHPFPYRKYLKTNVYNFRIATPFVKEQTSASNWLISHDVTVSVFNKLPKVSEQLGDLVDDTATERIMAIVGGFTTLKGMPLLVS